MLNGLSLFTGIGGIDVALSEYVRPVAYCELDPYCQAVLLSRMADESLPNSPIWNDITTLSGLPFNGSIDIIYGGFPCQDISIAGHGKGLEGERSGLVYEIFRLAEELRPSFVFLENVPAITTRGGVALVKKLTEMWYDCRWCVISAESVGASHKRERFFILAYSKSERSHQGGQSMRSQEKFPVANNKTKYDVWDDEPENKFELARVVNGVQDRTHRIKALGNAVVPIQAKEAFKILMGLK